MFERAFGDGPITKKQGVAEMKEIEEEINQTVEQRISPLKIIEQTVFRVGGQMIVLEKISRTLIFEEVKTHRFSGCAHYGECCYYAATEQWKSFSCSLCPVFKKAKMP